MVQFASEVGNKLPASTPYYAQANRQVVVENKIIIGLIKNYVAQKPKNLHKKLDQALCDCWTYRKEETNVTPLGRTFGRDVVFPAEIYMQSARIQRKNEIHSEHF